jgi:ABC-type transport system involved in cytochrome bd biosynthesis fused ATPase/permease subunit
VYDEPTAGLDPIAEHRIIERIMMHRKDHITHVVSHTMPVAKDADHILLVKDGRIIERGAHNALMAAGGAYSTMFLAQAKRYRVDPSQESLFGG